MPTYTILIVDDDPEIRDLLRMLLTKHGYLAFEADGSQSAIEFLAKQIPDLILLDIMMEGDDGLTLCKKIREISNVPIIMISAISEPIDKILALELGADDYITKPFYSREVITRIKTILRRCDNQASKNIQNRSVKFSGWTLYPDNRKLLDSSGIEISLSAGEYVLLESLIDSANKIITRDQLLAQMHLHAEQDVFDRSVDVQICRLRKRLEANPKNPVLIKTIRNMGYMFETKIEKS